MGLDMFLYGRRYAPYGTIKEGDFIVVEQNLELGYWRKHPNLHGYIVQTFDCGVDKCQQIKMTPERLEKILKAIENEELPATTGFFFGASDTSEKQKQSDITKIKKILEWLTAPVEKEYRSAYYQASW